MSKSKELEQDEFGNRMKQYEQESHIYVEPKEHMIVRLDGKKFSKFTKGFNKPFDNVLSGAMVHTATELMKEFGAVSSYQQSDEITLVFLAMYKRELTQTKDPYEADLAINKETGEEFEIETNWEEDEMYPTQNFYIDDDVYSEQIKYGRLDPETKKLPVACSNLKEINDKYDFFSEEVTNNQISNGRTDKVASIMASTATLFFNLYLQKALQDAMEFESEEYIEMLISKQFRAVFDARAFGVPNDIEAFNAVLWRMRDAEKNSKSMFTQRWTSHKETLNMNGDEKVQYCLEKTGKDWNKERDGYKYGFLIKKETYTKEVDEEYLKYGKEHANAERTRITIIEKKLEYSDENVELIIRRKL